MIRVVCVLGNVRALASEGGIGAPLEEFEGEDWVRSRIARSTEIDGPAPGRHFGDRSLRSIASA